MNDPTEIEVVINGRKYALPDTNAYAKGYRQGQIDMHEIDSVTLDQMRQNAVAEFITDNYGPRCKSKDTDDFPELKESEPQGRCACCEMWELWDAYHSDWWCGPEDCNCDCDACQNSRHDMCKSPQKEKK